MCGQTQHHLSQHISWQKRHANWPMMAMVLPHSTKTHLPYSGVASFHVLRTAHWPRPQGRCEKWSACTCMRVNEYQVWYSSTPERLKA